MVKKFNEFIEEGFLSKTLGRASSGERRKEEGTKVKTSIGVDIFLENPNYNYKSMIRDILDYGEDTLGVDVYSIGVYQYGEQKKIRAGEDPYVKLLKDDFVAGFDSYETLIDEGIIDEMEISEKDYLSIVNGVAEALGKVEFGKTKGSYESKTYLLLISENDLWDYESQLTEWSGEYWEDFKEYFEETYPDYEMETWSYANYSANIGIKLSYDSLLDYEDCREFIRNYFQGLVDSEKENREEE